VIPFRFAPGRKHPRLPTRHDEHRTKGADVRSRKQRLGRFVHVDRKAFTDGINR